MKTKNIELSFIKSLFTLACVPIPSITGLTYAAKASIGIGTICICVTSVSPITFVDIYEDKTG